MSGGESWEVDLGGNSSRKTAAGRPTGVASRVPSQSPGPGSSRFSRPAPKTRATDDGMNSPTKTPIASTRTSKIFKEDEMVKVKRKPPKPGYENARILSKNLDGTYDVRGEESGIERNVAAVRIVAMPDGSSNDNAASESKADGAAVEHARNFRMGHKIEAMHPKLGKWVSAMVVSVNVQDGLLDIRFQGGDEQKNGTY